MKYLIGLTLMLFALVTVAATTMTAEAVKGAGQNASVVNWRIYSADGSSAAIDSPSLMKRVVQVTGVFAGGTVTVQGSNDNTNWVTLKNAQGVGSGDATFTTAGIKELFETTRYVRATLSSSAASTDVSIKMLIVK